MCSILRRIIERVLERKVRKYVKLNVNQPGFMATPGTYINTKILNMVLKSAKKHKKDACIVFFDVTQAYDSVGDDHLIRK